MLPLLSLSCCMSVSSCVAPSPRGCPLLENLGRRRPDASKLCTPPAVHNPREAPETSMISVVYTPKPSMHARLRPVRLDASMLRTHQPALWIPDRSPTSAPTG